MMHEEFALKSYDHRHYSDISRLVKLKQSKRLTISLAIPTLNEEANIGNEVELVRKSLVEQHPLLDEIVVVDSGSTDNTREVAQDAGAEVYLAEEILPDLGKRRGKGENLWKSLHVLSGDIIVWADADIENFHPKFVYGLVGPLLENEQLHFIKAFYERPLAVGGDLLGTGGGRVTEILVRPVFACFYPELTLMFQPCAGEYAGRRGLLENLGFSMGYGVETGLLIDIFEQYGIEVMGQVNLDKRIHRNQSLEVLGKMSFEILHAFFNRLQKYGRVHLETGMSESFIRAHLDKSAISVVKENVQTGERPPISTIPTYLERRRTCQKWSWSGTDKHITIASV